MPGSMNTLLIEGSFEELSDELAHYVDEIRKRQGEDGASLQADITPILEQGQKDEVLKKLVTGSAILNAAPEKGGLHLSNTFLNTIMDINIGINRIYRCLQPPRAPRAPVS